MIPALFLRPLWALCFSLTACSAPDRVEETAQADAAPAGAGSPGDPAAAHRLRGARRGWSRRLRGSPCGSGWRSWCFRGSAASPLRRTRRSSSGCSQWVSRDEVGGLIVSTGTPAALAGKLNAAQMRAGVPLLIVSDLETGPGMRLTPGGTRMPPAMAFGAAGDTALARQAGRATAAEARAVGIHLTLGPLLDVNSNPANPIINVRSFGESPEQVARMGTAWLRGAREGGLLSAGKHFPGHGDTRRGFARGAAAGERGFGAAGAGGVGAVRARRVRAGIDGVLVGHIAAVGMEGPDAPPASLSPRMIGMAARAGWSFDGIVFTDALNMGGVTRRYSVSEASIRRCWPARTRCCSRPATRR